MPPQLSTMLTVVWCMAFKIESILWSALNKKYRKFFNVQMKILQGNDIYVVSLKKSM